MTPTETFDGLDDFAGAGGWDEGARMLGLRLLGVETDPDLRVRHPGGAVVYDNLYAAGGILAGATRWQEKSGEGIAVASAVRAADSILAAADSATTHGATTEGAAS